MCPLFTIRSKSKNYFKKKQASESCLKEGRIYVCILYPSVELLNMLILCYELFIQKCVLMYTHLYSIRHVNIFEYVAQN
jgi:hypothetical protein